MSNFFSSPPLRIEMDRYLVEKILRRLKVKTMSEYLRLKLQQDLEKLL